jgi:hydrogenase nickel incorporation protein HypA/HybF
MHELSVASAILRTASRHADERPVLTVGLRVGRLRQVVPDSLRFYWSIVARETVCERAQLEIAEIELRLRCRTCGREWEPLIPTFRCADCAVVDVEVLSGEELEIEYIEVEEREAACIAPR